MCAVEMTRKLAASRLRKLPNPQLSHISTVSATGIPKCWFSEDSQCQQSF